MVRSLIEQDELDSKMERTRPGGSREGSEEADTVVLEREDEAWARAVRMQRWFSVIDCSPFSTPIPTNLLLFCTF